MENLLIVKPVVDVKVINETCSRIGVANKRDKILWPSCYLWEYNNEYILAHFKQMFVLTRDDAYNAMTDDDYLRRNSIAYCLRSWGLVEVDEGLITPHDKRIFVLSHREKPKWRICHKFNMRGLDT